MTSEPQALGKALNSPASVFPPVKWAQMINSCSVLYRAQDWHVSVEVKWLVNCPAVCEGLGLLPRVSVCVSLCQSLEWVSCLLENDGGSR